MGYFSEVGIDDTKIDQIQEYIESNITKEDMEMKKEIALTSNSGFLKVSNLNEAKEFIGILAQSGMVPKSYISEDGSINLGASLIALDHGARVGLSPMMSLQSIAVINGLPTMWGDGMVGLCMASDKFEWMREVFDENTMTARCAVKRKGNPHLFMRKFSKEDAVVAGLWNKVGPWRQYGSVIMLRRKANGWALRAAFPDVLGGIMPREEVLDYPKKIYPNVDRDSEILYADYNGHSQPQESYVSQNCELKDLLKALWVMDSMDDLIAQYKILVQIFPSQEDIESIKEECSAVRQFKFPNFKTKEVAIESNDGE